MLEPDVLRIPFDIVAVKLGQIRERMAESRDRDQTTPGGQVELLNRTIHMCAMVQSQRFVGSITRIAESAREVHTIVPMTSHHCL